MTDELAEAKGKLTAAVAKLDALENDANPNIEQRSAAVNVAIAKAEVGVAEAKVGVAKAEVGVATERWVSASPADKETFRLNLETFRVNLETFRVNLDNAQQAHKQALDAAAPTPGGGGAAAGAAGDAGVGDGELANQMQELRLGFEAERERAEAERERAEKLQRQNTLATATPVAIFNLVHQELQGIISGTKQPPQSAPAIPPRFSTAAPGRSQQSSSTGTDASKVQFPNQHVDVSLLEFSANMEVPTIVSQLLWSTQMFLTELSEVFRNAAISEVNKIQPAIRAFFEVLVQVLSVQDRLVVPPAGQGVKTNVKFRGEQTVGGIPDFVVSSKARAPNGHWGGLTEGSRKLCKALLLGEVKLHHDAVCEALEHQARWYLFGASECLGSLYHYKGSHFGRIRYAVATDGFSWGFLKSEGVPDQDSAKWNIGRVEVSCDTEHVARSLVGMLREMCVNAPQAASGDFDDDSTSGSSGLLAAEQPGSVDNLSPGDGDTEYHDSLPLAGNPFGGGVHGVQSKDLKRLSNVSCAATVCKSSPIVRGDGIPRGMDVKAFAEMTSAERVEKLFGGGHG